MSVSHTNGRTKAASPGHSAIVNYDSTTGTLSVIFGAASHLDTNEILEDLYLFFDGSALGRLVKFQALAADDPAPGFGAVLTDCLGSTLGQRCADLIDGGIEAVAERVRVPLKEWAVLDEVQWPALHRSWRSAYDLPPILPDRRASAVVAIDRLLATIDGRPQPVDVAADEEPRFALRTSLSLPAPFAAIGAVEDTVEVSLEGNSAHVVAHPRAETDEDESVLEATVVWPEPVSADPVALTRVGDSLTAQIRLRESVDTGTSTRCLVRLSVRGRTRGGELHFPFVCSMSGPGGRVTQFLGVREASAAGARFAGPQFGRSANRVYWRTGKVPTEVAVVREGATLWARGYVSKFRRVRSVRVRCHLTKAAVVALQPDGRVDPDAGRIEVEGTLDGAGFFQIRLATVSDLAYDLEMVDSLDLEIG